MVDVNTIYTSDTLKAADLQGREHTVTIASVESKEFDNGIKLVLKFVGAKKLSCAIAPTASASHLSTVTRQTAGSIKRLSSRLRWLTTGAPL